MKQSYEYPESENEGNFFKQLGCTVGDYVTLKGIRREYPYRDAFYTTQLVTCGEGQLYPQSCGNEINHLKLKTVTILTIQGNQIND